MEELLSSFEVSKLAPLPIMMLICSGPLLTCESPHDTTEIRLLA